MVNILAKIVSEMLEVFCLAKGKIEQGRFGKWLVSRKFILD